MEGAKDERLTFGAKVGLGHKHKGSVACERVCRVTLEHLVCPALSLELFLVLVFHVTVVLFAPVVSTFAAKLAQNV